jgi:hypothetical protein
MHERRAGHRTIVVLDVEKFGDPRRTNPHQLAVREGLYQAVGDAFHQAELPWTPDAYEDRGDGILILVPPEFPKTLFVEKLPSALVEALTKHNREHPDEAGIRLRMSLHAGEVPYDPRGVYGRAVIWAFRLVDAKLLKAALADSSGVLAIIASSWFFEEVVQHAANGIPSTYRRVLVRAKESTQPGWICLPDDTTPVVEVASPYQGLRAFGKQDKRLFFGRETAIRDLAKAVARSALVPVVGKSGVGKSSLVQAGLLPSLEKTGWAIETILPRPSLPMALAAALARLSGAPGSDLDAWQNYLARYGLAAAAEKARKDRKDPTWQRAVIVIDQFEEALARKGESDPVLRELGDLRDGGLLTVVFTLREDSFGALFVSQPKFGERLRQNAIPLRGMDRHELTDAIRLPAEWYGRDVTDPLVEELIEAVRDNPGALPLLEFSLDQMWRALPRGEQRLSSDDERRIHGLEGVLVAHADRVLDSLSPAEQALVRNLFVNHLASVDQPDLRRVIRLSDCDPGYRPVIGRLADERLLTVGSDERGHPTAEVVHEALLRAWNQLHVWLAAEGEFRPWRKRLREDMRSWRGTGDSSELLTGKPLTDAERWLSDRAADLDVDEVRFIRASAGRRDEQENRYRTLYNRARARVLTHRAQSAKNPQQALRYALKLIELSPDPPACRVVRACLHNAGADELEPVYGPRAVAAAGRFRQRLTLAEWPRGPVPDGYWLLGDPDTGLVISEDGDARYRAGTALAMPGPVVVAACTRTGLACLVTEYGQLALWQLAYNSGQAEKLGEQNFDVPVACVAVSDKPPLVAVALGHDGEHDKIRVFDGKALSPVGAFSLDGFVWDIDLSPDRKVAALDYDGRLWVWDLVTQRPFCESVTELGVTRLAFDEDYVAVGEIGTGAWGRFPVHPDRLAEQARQTVNGELTAEELAELEDPSD